MKIFISADIEGTTGITNWNETEKGHADYSEFREQMTAEVNAACEGALEAGANEIVVKDSHDSARNIIFSKLPKEVKLIRGWAAHPYCMMYGIDSSFDAAIMTGYHSSAFTNNNPLAHTLTGKVFSIKINNILASEYLINSLTAAYENVPVIFLSGDKGLCEHAKTIQPGITTVSVSEGSGASTLNIHPQKALEQIKESVKKALKTDLKSQIIELPEYFEVELSFVEHALAKKASFYPGAELKNAKTINFEANDYFDVLRMLQFVL